MEQRKEQIKVGSKVAVEFYETITLTTMTAKLQSLEDERERCRLMRAFHDRMSNHKGYLPETRDRHAGKCIGYDAKISELDREISQIKKEEGE